MAQKIVVATGNAGKLRELNTLLADMDVELVTQTELGVTEAVEDGLTFLENALIKARNASRQTGLAAVADDSGIVVDALGGAPGIYSARYAGSHGDDAANNRKLVSALAEMPSAPRTARFFCAAVYVGFPDDPCPVVAQASWEGSILDSPRGENGFGYDPLFAVTGDTRTAAELDTSEKNAISHRAKAVRAMVAELKSRMN